MAALGAVHPFDVEGPAPAVEAQPEGGLNGLPLLAGTALGLSIRGAQAVAAGVALAVLNSAVELPTLHALWYLSVATKTQITWSFAAILLDLYAACVGRSLLNIPSLLFLVLADTLIGCMIFCTAWMSAGVVVYIATDLDICAGHPCARFQVGIALALCTCTLMVTSLLLSLWGLLSRWFSGILPPVHYYGAARLGAAIADLYALYVGCSLQNIPFLLALVLGDLMDVDRTGVIIYIDSDLDLCATHPCARFKTTIAISFFNCFLLVSSLFLSLWALVSRLIAGFLCPP